jgi:hypothetical protein
MKNKELLSEVLKHRLEKLIIRREDVINKFLNPVESKIIETKKELESLKQYSK